MKPRVGAGIIELRVEEIAQLFDSFDPFPFRERDLDKNAEEYIVAWARELPRDQNLKIIVYAPDSELRTDAAYQLRPALTRYFAYRAEVTDRDLNELFRVGLTSLMIGAGVLAACIFVARVLTTIKGYDDIRRFIEESLIIFGWVANWRPIEIFLYDWWPVARWRDLYRRLAVAEIEIASLPHASSGLSSSAVTEPQVNRLT
jgi:hypothetical protein